MYRIFPIIEEMIDDEFFPLKWRIRSEQGRNAIVLKIYMQVLYSELNNLLIELM